MAEQARIVRLPLNKIGIINKVNKAFAELEQELGRTPTIDELAEVLEVSEQDVKYSISNSGRHVSMDAPLKEGDEGSSSMYDVLQNPESNNPEKDLIAESLRSEIERSLSTLKMREADVIRLYFGLGDQPPMTLAEIGFRFDLTRERVRQIKEKAIRKLKNTSRSKMLRAYLG